MREPLIPVFCGRSCSLSHGADGDYHPWVLHLSLTTKIPPGCHPRLESWYPDIPGSSQSAVPHPLPGLWQLQIKFLSRFCFLFLFISLGWVFLKDSQGLGTVRARPSSPGTHRTQKIPGKAQCGQSWTKQDCGCKSLIGSVSDPNSAVRTSSTIPQDPDETCPRLESGSRVRNRGMELEWECSSCLGRGCWTEPVLTPP